MSTTRDYDILTACIICEEEDSTDNMRPMDEDGETFAHPICDEDARFEADMVRAEARRDAQRDCEW